MCQASSSGSSRRSTRRRTAVVRALPQDHGAHDDTDVPADAQHDAGRQAGRKRHQSRRPTAQKPPGMQKPLGRDLSSSTVSTMLPGTATVLMELSQRGEVVYDVVADGEGQALLLPVDVDGTADDVEAVRASDMPQDGTVTIRVFRFFEDFSDEKSKWEKELRNVNSGSLLWLLVHLRPKMHSVAGAKYGSWFTTHYVRVKAAHFQSPYHMCEEGGCVLAQTFGTAGVKRLVTGEQLATGYFWFSTPDRAGSGPSREDVSDAEHLELHGWQHLGREQPVDGDAFSEAWQAQRSLVDEAAVRFILHSWA